MGLGVIDSEHVLFILACFVSHLEGVKLDRVVYKFKEEKCEKVHRLVAMFGVYLEREEAPQEEEEQHQRCRRVHDGGIQDRELEVQLPAAGLDGWAQSDDP